MEKMNELWSLKQTHLWRSKVQKSHIHFEIIFQNLFSIIIFILIGSFLLSISFWSHLDHFFENMSEFKARTILFHRTGQIQKSICKRKHRIIKSPETI